MKALALALLLAACAATPRTAPAPRPPSALPLAELPPQRLAKGDCALFLWERSAAGRRVLMATPAPPRVRVALGGATLDLPLVRADGPTDLGFPTRATYSDGRVSVALDLAFEMRPGLVGGAVVRDGSLALTTADGAEVVSPVAGLLGCR